MRGIVRREQEVLLREGHLISFPAYSDQWEAFLWRPRAHHLWHVLVLCRDLDLGTGGEIQSHVQSKAMFIVFFSEYLKIIVGVLKICGILYLWCLFYNPNPKRILKEAKKQVG